jgi:hypothetical protein
MRPRRWFQAEDELVCSKIRTNTVVWIDFVHIEIKLNKTKTGKTKYR